MAGSSTRRNLGRAATAVSVAALGGYAYGRLSRARSDRRLDRRSGVDRRMSAQPVQVERRSGGDRRTGRDRRTGWERRSGLFDSSTYG
jgi:hypothetical protein